MKKVSIILLLIFAPACRLLAQQINIDSIVKVVIARNPRVANSRAANTDSLFTRLQRAKTGAEKIDLVYKMYDVFANSRQNATIGYRLLTWAKSHHDLVTEAVIASEMGTVMCLNGDKATGSDLETEALAAATQAGDRQALGVVYQNSFARADFTEPQMKGYALKALKMSRVVNDVRRIGWDYADLGREYIRIKKPDSANYYYTQALTWAVRANSVFDICQNICNLAISRKDKGLQEKYLKASYTIANQTNTAAAICYSCDRLGYYYTENNKIDPALFYSRIAYQTSLQLTVNFQIGPARQISNLYLKKRNIDSMVKYLDIYYGLREQLFNNQSVVRAQARDFAQKQKQQQTEVQKTALKHIQQLWALGIAITLLLLIAFIFWRSNRQSKKANTLITRQKQQTEIALANLKAAQVQLVQSEKMASLGELTAGIAHEIQNPLNFVNNFSEVNREMIDELKEELKTGNINEAIIIADDIRQNEEKISHHGKRADFIVKGMLQHSRTGTGERQFTNINILADEFLKLSFHGLRSKDKSFNAAMVTHFDDELPKVNVVQQDMGRVLLNLFNNAFYAVHEKVKTAGGDYKPEVSVTTASVNNQIVITVQDNGIGIPHNVKDKIMQPFFTTKPTGQGTGLGLSLSYDIVVKGHGGHIKVDSSPGEGSVFTITLPG